MGWESGESGESRLGGESGQRDGQSVFCWVWVFGFLLLCHNDGLSSDRLSRCYCDWVRTGGVLDRVGRLCVVRSVLVVEWFIMVSLCRNLRRPPVNMSNVV